MQTTPHRGNKRVWGRIIALAVVASTVFLTWFVVQRAADRPLSEDAVIQADVVHISTPVAGRVMEFHVRDSSRVKRGDLLFSLDPLFYQLRVEQAEAEVLVAQAAVAASRRTVNAEGANAKIANEQIARARHNLALAERTLARLQPLSGKGYVTQQQLDDAATLKRDAQVSLKQALSQAEAAEGLVGNLDAAQALVQVSQSALAIAKKALADTKVYAPHDGLVVGLNVSVGEYVAPDQSLFTLINTENWYATAFFRETELSDIKIGTCASVYVLGWPGSDLKGRVESIGWGVSSEEMIRLPRSLPYIQKSLNWVRVAQRFPVRISLKDPDEHLMRVGASLDVVIRNGSDC